MIRHMLFCFGLLLSSAVNADVGTIKEAIKAAKDGVEPAYIATLMDKLGQKLHQITKQVWHKYPNPTQRIAWVSTMQGVVSDSWGTAGQAAAIAAQKAARNSAEDAAWDAAWNAAWNAAQKAARSASGDTERSLGVIFAKDAAEDAVRKVTIDAARSAAAKALKRCTASSEKEAGTIAYRVAEWVTLHYLLQNIERIVLAVYPHVVKALGGIPPDNPVKEIVLGLAVLQLMKWEPEKMIFLSPFVTQGFWLAFYNKHFAALKPEAMIFLAPWLTPIEPLEPVDDL